MKAKKWIAILMAAALAVSTAACGGGDESSTASGGGKTSPAQSSQTGGGEETPEDGPMTPYAESYTANFGRDMDINNSESAKLADFGEPYTDNRWTRLFEEKLNIKTNYELIATGDQYNQQIKLQMSSGELPDFFAINNWSDFQQMAEGGLLADMTDLYEKYASPLLRSIIEDESDKAFLPVFYEGRIYGVPRIMPSTNGYNHLWIRQDWLDNLKLDRPKTMDDVLNIARAFKNNDPDGNGENDTLGMRLDNAYKWAAKGFFWGYGAYPDIWITKEDGSIDFGSVQPEMKKGIQFIKTMLEEGLVDPEFATTERNTSMEDVTNGTIGMYYGCHWETPKDNVLADSNANWVVIPLPTEDGSPVRIPLSLGCPEGAYCATVNAEHPEAVIKMLNVYVEALFGENGDFNKYFAVEGVSPIWNYGPVNLLDPEIDVDAYRQWKAACETGDYENMTGSGKGFYEYNEAGLIEYGLMFGPGESAFAFVDQTYPDQVMENAYFGAATPTQVERGSSMNELIDTTLAALMTGQLDLDSGFDQMVSDWRGMGGDQVIQEIQEILDAYENR